MRRIISIHKDDYTGLNRPPESDAAAPRWARLLEEAGYEIRWVDVCRADILEQLEGSIGFMWRWAHFNGMGRIARRLLPVLERELKLVIYPDQNTCWHYDDKIAQTYLLKAAGIPIPKTWIIFTKVDALEWSKSVTYPLVLKLATGASSSNVRLIQNQEQLLFWIDRMFSIVGRDLLEIEGKVIPIKRRFRKAARILIRYKNRTIKDRFRDVVHTLIQSKTRPMLDNGLEPQSGYIFAQEYLPNNHFDTRVTVIGNRAFSFRRFNRDNDFRASGSGKIDYDQIAIDQGFIRAAFRATRALKSQSCAIDGLYRGQEHLIGEISYTYISKAVYDCPGHWELKGNPEDGTLTWIDGHMWPEQAQIEDFICRLENKYILSSS